MTDVALYLLGFLVPFLALSMISFFYPRTKWLHYLFSGLMLCVIVLAIIQEVKQAPELPLAHILIILPFIAGLILGRIVGKRFANIVSTEWNQYIQTHPDVRNLWECSPDEMVKYMRVIIRKHMNKKK